MTQDSSSSPHKLLITDQLPTRDSFNRRALAEYWATEIRKGTPTECLVIGIEGGWGTGKSTFADYLIKAMTTDEPKPLVIDFRPWLFANREELIRQFFQTLRENLSDQKTTLWPTTPKFNYDRALDVVSILLSVGELSPVGSNYFSVGNGWFKKIRGIGGDQKLEAGTLAAQKSGLDKSFLSLQRRVIVLIDDTDRLEPEAAATILQLVRMNASFPNFSYVLPYDSAALSESVSKHFNMSDGQGYIDKIVTVPLALPLPTKTELVRFFNDQIRGLFKDASGSPEIDITWQRLTDQIIGSELSTPRSMLRLANALSVSMGPIEDEIDARDLVTIEMIRIQHPKVHKAIRDNRDFFCGPADYMQGQNEKSPDGKQRKSALNQSVQETLNDSGCSVGLVESLFPAYAIVESDERYDVGRLSRLRTDKRVASPERFLTYFTYRLDEGLIPDDIRSTLIASHDVGDVIRILQQMKADTQLQDLFDQFPSYPTYVDPGDANVHFTALMEFADETSQDSGSGALVDDHLAVVSIANAALERVPVEDRLELVVGLASGVERIGSVVRYVSLLEGNRESPLDPSALEMLKVKLSEQMAQQAKDGRLFSEPLGAVKYFRWRDWDSDADLTGSIQVALKSNDTAVGLLRSFMGASSTSDGSGLTRITYYPQVEGLDEEALELINAWVVEHLPDLEFDPRDKTAWMTYRVRLLTPDERDG